MLLWIVALAGQLIIQESCKKKETQPEPEYLAVTISKAEFKNENYYLVDHEEMSVELEFSQELDSSSIAGNISMSDKNGVIDSMYTLIYSGRKLILAFRPGFRFNDGWQYMVSCKTGLKSTSGLRLASSTVIELRTSSKLLFLDNESTQRNSMICISDIHMGDARAVAKGYCWFSKNADALVNLLDDALTSPQVRQVVILGDLFDEWVIPYRMSPFDSVSGVHDSRDYFLSVANSPTNQPVINKLRAIASSGTVQLVYVPGNHDMLLTEQILREIIPGIIWQGDSPGLGHYSPVSEIIMEHGHRFDFFNCPQPLANPGHMLPPGFFVSRLQAQGLMDHGSAALKNMNQENSGLEFLTAWTAALTYLQVKFSETLAQDSANILMGGIDSYNPQMSYHGVRDMYAGGIENVWPATEAANAVPVTMPVLMAILDGSSDMYFTAGYEYMQPQSPKQYKIVAFGHTHDAEVTVYPKSKQYTGIYANTGTWVNAELCSDPVRTYLVIRPGAWTGSELDVVSLYQYNLDSGGGNPSPQYLPVLLSEESIAKGN